MRLALNAKRTTEYRGIWWRIIGDGHHDVDADGEVFLPVQQER